MSEQMKNLVKSVHRLSATDPKSGENVVAAVANVSEILQQFDGIMDGADGSTMDVVETQIDNMITAASVPAQNYKRIASILSNLKRLCVEARKPQNAAVRPRVASAIRKVAGLFAQVDTAEDLDKPLNEIEKAVHSMYGDQGKNATFYLERRGKGHYDK